MADIDIRIYTNEDEACRDGEKNIDSVLGLKCDVLCGYSPDCHNCPKLVLYMDWMNDNKKSC